MKCDEDKNSGRSLQAPLKRQQRRPGKVGLLSHQLAYRDPGDRDRLLVLCYVRVSATAEISSPSSPSPPHTGSADGERRLFYPLSLPLL